ncbi:Phage protein [Sodalis praecaptivus]|uniref:Phage protein n=1 Tax=Sodalis praecaptivus TaxID=1239307 RepID=W0I0G2_9GAMM|nr:Phage protein [Sodalis praecaptivus]
MMADDIDNAALLEQFNNEIALLNRPRPQFVYTGKCHWCDEPIANGCFCKDDSCAEDYENYKRAERRRGRA